MSRGIDFKQKEVVSITEGKIVGFVVDVQADFQTGEINSIIVAKTGKLFNSLTSFLSKIVLIGKFCTALRITKCSHTPSMLRFRSLV